MTATYGNFLYGQGIYGGDCLPILVTDRTRGFYNAPDLNRVETATEYLKEQFNNLPAVLADYLASLNVALDTIFAVPYEYPLPITTKTNWTDRETPNNSDMARYLGNVATLRGTIALPDTTPTLPASVRKLKFDGANDIEKVLQIINAETLKLEAHKKLLADNTAAIFVYSGEIYSGE